MMHSIKRTLIGLIVFLPTLLLAAPKTARIVERTMMDIPVVGEITTIRTTHVGECQILERRDIKIHNLLARMFGGDGKSTEFERIDLCQETVTHFDSEDGETRVKTFAEVRQEPDESDTDIHIDNENDEEPATITREFSRKREIINGHRCRLVTTRILMGEKERPLIIRQWVARKIEPLERRNRQYERFNKATDQDRDAFQGVPDFINAFLQALEEDQDLQPIEGYMVRAEIRLDDADGDPVFHLAYDLKESAMLAHESKQFAFPHVTPAAISKPQMPSGDF